jgi:GNAT superfamily N-acetyltransferase
MSKEDLEMGAQMRIVTFVIVVFIFCVPTVAAGADLRDALQPHSIASVRVNLLPRGAQLGFEFEVPGDDRRVEALAALIREAEPGGGHKCANAGAIRFRMEDGTIIGVGLLPSHAGNGYGLRLYEGDRFVAVYQVERAALLAALEDLGVPMDDPAFTG